MDRRSSVERSQLLPYTEHHTEQESTVVLLHGALSTSNEYRFVAPLLTSYHVLVPTLPGHNAQISKPSTASAGAHRHFTLEGAAAAMSHLIAEVAHGYRAHVVGVSLGAHVGVYLAAHHPQCVSSLLVSGFGIFERRFWSPAMPYAMLGMEHITGAIPGSLRKWLLETMLSALYNWRRRW